jgi:short-subunit dehydrogenase
MSTRSQIVLVTGATSGIGRYAALHLARAGHVVFASGRKASLLEELRAEAQREGVAVETVLLDVTDAASIDRAHAEVLSRTDGHGVDVLINNAGFGISGPMSEIDDADLRRQFETNVFGVMAVTRAFLPDMLRRGAGKVLNVSSVGGLLTLPLFGAYNATKYAIESMSDALRVELRPLGIHVVLIEPGIINTNFTQHTVDEASHYGKPGSPFAAVMARYNGLAKRSDSFGVSPKGVARAMERAIRRRRPAARYIAPFRTRFFLGFYRLMPTRLMDAIFRGVYGMNRKNMSAQQTSAAVSDLASVRRAA